MSVHIVDGRWTDESKAEIERLWISGQSATEIMHAMGCDTRNQIISIVHRMGLKRDMPIASQSRSRHALDRERRFPKQKGVPAVRITPTKVIMKPSPSKPLPPPKIEPVSVTMRPWEERERGHCAWPLDGPDGAVWSCCRRCEGTYCVEHMERRHAPKPRGGYR